MTQSATPRPAATPAIGRKWRILYAEDVRELRDVARMSLTRDGHVIECVVDGQAALDRLTANPTEFELLLTDHHMPNMNGLELVARLRAMNFPGKIIVFSSELKQNIHDAYVALKVDLVLPKPIFPSELRRILGDL